MGSEITQSHSETDLDNLFQFTMKKDWDNVVKVYREHAWARTSFLTKPRATALHVAVSNYNIEHSDSIQFHHVETMIKSIPQEHLCSILSSPNHEGNTVLHIAAAVGWEDMCKHIAEMDETLIKKGNKKNETPLFVAAQYGNLEAFVSLHETYMNSRKVQEPDRKVQEPDYSLCRRNDGMTVLHSAIVGEHFELAYQIMSDYKKLMTSVNEAGESPLHVLAKKPNVFESCSSLRFYGRIIYRCVSVDELKKYKRMKRPVNSTERHTYPKNYQTCVSIIWSLWRPIISSYKASHRGKPTATSKDEENQQTSRAQGKSRAHYYPPNYTTCILLFKFGMKVILTVLGLGFDEIKKIEEKKRRHRHAITIMNKLIESELDYKYNNDGQQPEQNTLPGRDDIPMSPPVVTEDSSDQAQQTDAKKMDDNDNNPVENRPTSASKPVKNITPLLIAAKMGIREIVEEILKTFPVAIHDVDSDGKSVLLLAAENRQTTIFKHLLHLKLPPYLFHQVDKNGNSVLHLAAVLGDHEPWCIPGAALQMQGELLWYKYVKRKTPQPCYSHDNTDGETARKIFSRTHEPLVEKGSKWLIKTSESCSVVAALIATVAFATSATVPGGLNETSGHPIMINRRAFDIFSITSLLALCLSVTSLVFFLAIITSRCQERDFKSTLPGRLMKGLTALFASIAAILVSFCAGHTFILGETVKIAAVPIYALACVPVTMFALAQLPLWFDLLSAAQKGVPVRSYKAFHH